MKLDTLISSASDKQAFNSVQDYADFALKFLDYIEKNKQAEIVAHNDHHYRFFQFDQAASFKVSRPFNADLLYRIEEADSRFKEFFQYLVELRENQNKAVINECSVINRAVYTFQQTIGFALDAGTALGVEPNVARKVNGDLFERLIYLVINDIGLRCRSGVVKIPVVVDGKSLFDMSYQHDLIVEDEDGKLLIIGSAKTTSKDRIDKIFMDKFLYCRLTDTQIPHIAVFLHDVQRKKTKTKNVFGINTTFLSGHFKGYTVKLNPLDGVYYCDPRPIMQTDDLIKQHISKFDVLLCKDIWKHI